MSDKHLEQDTIGELFMTVMQHMKCIETRLDFARVQTSQKQKYALGNAVQKVRVAIDHLCGLLGNTQMTLEVKKQLDKADLVYVMLLTEKFSSVPPEDLEEIDTMIEDYLIKKYGEAHFQVLPHGEEPVRD